MATLQFYADRFINVERPAGIVLDPESVETMLVKATEFYSGYARLKVHDAAIAIDTNAVLTIDMNTDVSWSEMALIAPVWHLYVEREQALQIEAGRIQGIEGFGRSSSEVGSEIQLKEQEFPRLAFVQEAFTIAL